MLEQCESLTQKYAQAFFNLYEKKLSDAVIDQIIVCANFLHQKQAFDAFLLLSIISQTEKINVLSKMCDSFCLPSEFLNLCRTLLDHRRIDLLSQILKKIACVYKEQKNVVNFTIYTSHDIDEDEKKTLISFIKNKNKKTIIADFLVDSTLICGIKIKSSTLQWERSIAKQLKNIKLDALQQVQL
jgi:ATP synthase F1 delta subunit